MLSICIFLLFLILTRKANHVSTWNQDLDHPQNPIQVLRSIFQLWWKLKKCSPPESVVQAIWHWLMTLCMVIEDPKPPLVRFPSKSRATFNRISRTSTKRKCWIMWWLNEKITGAKRQMVENMWKWWWNLLLHLIA